MTWFAPPPDADAIACGARGQNRAAVASLLACLHRRQAIHAGPQGVAAAGPQPWVFCQSSGSSGRAKTIRRSQASWIASFQVNRALLGITPRDRYAVLGELGHSLALYAAVEALHLGCGLMLLAGDSPRAQLAALARATVLYATPTQLRRLLLAARGDTLAGMAQVICGGGKLDAACRQGLTGLFPNAALREFYGASETSFITIADDRTPPGSVGRAYPGVEMQLAPDGGIWVRSPYLFDGYTEPGPQIARRADGFVSVGDLGRLDGQGYLFLQGRASRVVTIADRNLCLDEVEAVLAAAGAGVCAALALPDAQRGHALLAVVEGPENPALARALRRACRDELGDHAVPRWIRHLPALPLLASGKPDLVALAAHFAPMAQGA